jgi:hypothetical protein
MISNYIQFFVSSTFLTASIFPSKENFRRQYHHRQLLQVVNLRHLYIRLKIKSILNVYPTAKLQII